jgi:hypothetical protein
MQKITQSRIVLVLILSAAFAAVFTLPVAASPWKSNQTKLYPVTRGDWGGQSVSFVVEKNAVKIEFDCAEGEIPRPLKADKTGKFRVEGTFTRHMPGPVRRDSAVKPVPARYEGVVKGKIIKLKVTLLNTNESAGEFTIELGRTPSLTRCY